MPSADRNVAHSPNVLLIYLSVYCTDGEGSKFRSVSATVAGFASARRCKILIFRIFLWAGWFLVTLPFLSSSPVLDRGSNSSDMHLSPAGDTISDSNSKSQISRIHGTLRKRCLCCLNLSMYDVAELGNKRRWKRVLLHKTDPIKSRKSYLISNN